MNVEIVPNSIQRFMLVEAAVFSMAALIHSGVLIDGYQHRQARIAETVIAFMLLLGLALSWIRPALSRVTGLTVQACALFGTLVGIFTMVVGVGPRTWLDVVYHIGIVLVLVVGLIVVKRAF